MFRSTIVFQFHYDSLIDKSYVVSIKYIFILENSNKNEVENEFDIYGRQA